MEIEDYVELAHVAVVFIHLFHVAMHDLEGDEFIVGRSTAGDEEERGVTSVDYLGIYDCEQVRFQGLEYNLITFVLEEVAHASSS